MEAHSIALVNEGEGDHMLCFSIKKHNNLLSQVGYMVWNAGLDRQL